MADQINLSLSDIAKYAYGSGKFEGKSGGAGNIGLLNGKVVKFNTHHGERGGAVTQQMRESCDALRLQMYDLVRTAYDGANVRGKNEQLAKVRQQLGLSNTGESVVSKKLLDRTTVATIINQLEQKTGSRVWNLVPQDAAQMSSAGKDTKFLTALKTAADERLQQVIDANEGNVEISVNDAAELLKGGIHLDVAARQLMMGIVRDSIADSMDRSTGFYNGTDNFVNLDYKGSTLDLLKQVNLKTTQPLILARSLPSNQARAFLKACTLFGNISDVNGLGARLHSVAKQLAELKDDQFTVANVIRLAYPGEKKLEKEAVKLCNTEKKIPDDKMGNLAGLVNQTVADKNDDALLDDDAIKYTAIETRRNALLSVGFKPSDVRQIMADQKNFRLSMIPSSLFLFGFRDNEKNYSAMDVMLKDLARNQVDFEIDQGGDNKWKLSEKLGEKFKAVAEEKEAALKDRKEDLRAQLVHLCGDKQAMMDNICLFMSQNAQPTESALAAILGKNPNEFDTKATFTFKSLSNGDVMAMRKGAENSNVRLNSVFVFHTDGRIEPVTANLGQLQEQNAKAVQEPVK